MERLRLALIIETARVFLRLGCTSFGGPVAHLGYFQNELVRRRQWVSEAAYADVVALCQFLPGPASSQVCFVLGYLRSGLLGGILGWMAFTAPSAALMIGFAYGVHFLNTRTAGWLLGLKVAAIAVVAQAIWLMARKLCPDLPRFTLAAVAAMTLILFHAAWLQPAAIAAGALFGFACWRTTTTVRKEDGIISTDLFLSRRWGGASLALFTSLLGICLSWQGGGVLADSFARFYRTGSLVFGGGHVVLPLLQAETVQSHLVSHTFFVAGYGAAQALPGPLFTFAAFLGAGIPSAYPPWLLGLWCLFAILLPSLLLIVGALPFWAQISGSGSMQAAMKGANAVVVGLLLAAFYDPVCLSGNTSPRAALLAVGAFALLQFAKAPNWVVVILCAATGEWLL